MRVLVACEESQVVCKAFRAIGHEAYSCDIQDCSGGHPEWHLKMDVFEAISLLQMKYGKINLMIGHPPCDFIANSGVRWLKGNRQRWEDMKQGALFFKKLFQQPIDRIVIENPIPHMYAVEYIGSKYDQLIHPWQFGHKQMKATCLWIKGVEKLKPTDIVGPPPKDKKERYKWQNVWTASPGPNRKKIRSKTFQGIADAMANQWG